MMDVFGKLSAASKVLLPARSWLRDCRNVLGNLVVRGFLLFVVVPLTVVSCTEGAPEFTDLGSEFRDPTFDSASKLYLISDLSSDSPAISGTCDDDTLTIGTRPDGKNGYDDVQVAAVSPSSDLDCSDGTFSLVLSQAGSYMGFTDGISAQKSLYIRTMANDGDSAEGEVYIRYLPEVPRLSVYPLVASVAESQTASFRVSIVPRAEFGALVDYESVEGTARASDFTAVSGAISFGATDDYFDIEVSLNDDALYELDEVFYLSLSGEEGGNVSVSAGDVTVTSADAPPTAFVESSVNANEGDDLVFAVSLDAVSGANAVVDWQNFAGTATFPSDFVSDSGQVTIPEGVLFVNLTIPTVEDLDYEASESVVVSINANSGVQAGFSTGTGNILNDDNPPSILVDDFSVNEAITGYLVVSLSATSTVDAVFSVQTYDVTAIGGLDYSVVSAVQATISAGDLTLAVFEVDGFGDSIYEGVESYVISLTAISGIHSSGNDLEATGSVQNQTPAPDLFIDNLVLSESTSLPIVVSISTVSDVDVTFDYQTYDGSAVSLSGDYTYLSGRETVPAGSLTTFLMVVADNDAVVESDEDFLISFSNVNNASAGGDWVGSVTINDDDSTLNLFVYDASATEGSSLEFDVSISAISAFPVNFSFQLFDGTAEDVTGDADYGDDSGVSLLIPAGSQVVSVTVFTNDDAKNEPTETMTISLSSIVGANVITPGTDNVATGSILDNDAPPQIFVDDLSLNEGTTSNLVVSLSAENGVESVFDLETFDDSAAQPGDYTQVASQRVTIAAGALTAIGGDVLVDALREGLDENDEQYWVSLTPVSGISAGGREFGAVTIHDQDAAPTIFVDDISVTEPDSSDLVISISEISGREITFDYAIQDTGGAQGAIDFAVVSSTTATIAAGSLAVTILDGIAVFDDNISESTEQFAVSLSALGNVGASDDFALVDITDDEAPVRIFVQDLSQFEGSAGIAPVEVVVSLSNPNSIDVAFDFYTADNAASNPTDYSSVSSSSTISAGELQVTIDVDVNGDTLYEVDEDFSFVVTNVTGGAVVASVGVDDQALVNLQNDDLPPEIFIDDLAFSEETTGWFIVSLGAISEVDAVFSWFTNDSFDAVAGADYTASTGTGTIGAGGLEVSIPVAAFPADLLDEPNEQFRIDVTPISGISLAGGDQQAIGTITDNDGGPNIHIDSVSVGEGASALLSVSLSAVTALDVSFDLSTYDDSADGSADYTPVTITSITIGAGSLTAGGIYIETTVDSLYELDETLVVSISNENNAGVVGAGFGFVTISNDDPVPQLTVFDVAGNEGATVDFIITLNVISGVEAAFDYVLMDGTASVADSDYSSGSGRLTIAAGLGALTVPANGDADTKFENDEFFLVSLHNFSGVTVASIGSDDVGAITLVNEDSQPNVNIYSVTVGEGDTVPMVVSLSAVSGLDSSFSAEFYDGALAPSLSAQDSGDYTDGSFSLVIPAGAVTTFLTIGANTDSLYEFDEVYLVSLGSLGPEVTAGLDVANVTIVNIDSEPDIYIFDAIVDEGDSALVIVSLNTVSGVDVDFDYQVFAASSGNLADGADVTLGASGSDFIFAGGVQTTVFIQTIEDAVPEPDELFEVRLTNQDNANPVDNIGVVTIANDDTVNNLVVYGGGILAEGGLHQFVVSLDSAATADVEFSWRTYDGTATDTDIDYDGEPTPLTVTISTGASQVTLDVQANDDQQFESDEDFSVSLSAVSGPATLLTALASATIANDETLEIAFISPDGVVNEGDDAPAESSRIRTVVSSGEHHMCGLGTDSKAYCWGLGLNGRLGDGTSTNRDRPTAVLDGDNATGNYLQLALGYDHTCGIGDDNRAYCWGMGLNGRLGHAQLTGSNQPVQVSLGFGDGNYTQITAGEAHTCALSEDFKAYCWGNPGNGRMGNGFSAGTFSIPQDVELGAGPGHYKQIVAGAAFTCGLGVDSRAYCWGSSSDYQLGGGVIGERNTPSLVLPGESSGVFKSIAAGNGHTCAIGTDEQLYCWGRDANGQLGLGGTGPDQSVPRAVSLGDSPGRFKRIALGYNHTCAIGEDDRAYCWGAGTNGRLGDQDTTDNLLPTMVSLGAGPSNYHSLAAGLFHTCGHGFDNRLYCWGRNTFTQLGNGSSIDSTSPVAAVDGASPGTFLSPQINIGSDVFVWMTAWMNSDVTVNLSRDSGTALSGGTDYTINPSVITIPAGLQAGRAKLDLNDDALVEGDEIIVLSLASPSNGILGAQQGQTITIADDDFAPSVPGLTIYDSSAVNEGETAEFVVSLSASYGSDVEFDYETVDGAATAADSDFIPENSRATIAAGDLQITLSVETLEDSQFETTQNFALSLSNQTNSTLSDDVGFADIDNVGGLTIEFVTSQQEVSELVGSSFEGSVDLRFSGLALGESHTCAIAVDSSLYCWGSGASGKLGDNNWSTQSLPVQVSASLTARSYQLVDSTDSHTCAIGADSRLSCWGRGTDGQLGHGMFTTEGIPTPVHAGDGPGFYNRVSAGNSHTCAIGVDQYAYCWGDDASGQLGNGSDGDSSQPALVSAGDSPGGNFKEISAGTGFVCAIGSDDNGYCWGNGGSGRQGSGSLAGQDEPGAMVNGDGPGTYKRISVGVASGCALGTDDQAYCWGANSNGQLGDGTTSQRTSPVAVSLGEGPSDYLEIAAGDNHVCAIGSDNKVYCWGAGSFGRLGNGGASSAAVPAQVNLGAGPGFYTHVEAGDSHTCAIGVDSEIYCWGQGTSYRLGDGNSTDRTEPVQVLNGSNVDDVWGTTPAVLGLRMSAWFASDVTVPFTVGGNAVAGTDYELEQGSVFTIPAGEQYLAGGVNVVDDFVANGDIYFSVTLGTPSVGLLGATDSHTVSITDNEYQEPSITIASSGSVQEITIPSGVTEGTFKLWGAGGGAGLGDTTATNRAGGGGGAGSMLVRNVGDVTIAIAAGGGGGGAQGATENGAGGSGAYVELTMDVNPGEVFTVYVGGGGESGCTASGGDGGGPGGGAAPSGSASNEVGGGAGDNSASNAGDGSLAGGGGGDARGGDSGRSTLGGIGGELGGGAVPTNAPFSYSGIFAYGGPSGDNNRSGGGGGFYVNTFDIVARDIVTIAGGSPSNSNTSAGAAFGSYGAGASGPSCGGFGGDGHVIFEPPQVDTPNLAVGEGSGVEGEDIVVLVTLSVPATDDVVFNWRTFDDTALVGDSDYTSVTSGQATIAAGNIFTALTVVSGNDSITELDESFLVSVSYFSGNYSITGDVGSGVIEDDDSLGLILVVDGGGQSTIIGGGPFTACGGGRTCDASNPYLLDADVVYDAVSVVNGGVLSATGYSGGVPSLANGVLQIKVKDMLYIDSTSAISMSGRGYRGNDATGRGAGDSANGYESYGGVHAGGGGEAEHASYTNAAQPYGHFLYPTEIGGSGGQVGGSVADSVIPRGGGAVSIASDGVVDLRGSILAAGEDGITITGDNQPRAIGGGAGGSVLIETVSLTGFSATIDVTGGEGATHTTPTLGSGGGSGGRVAIFFEGSDAINFTSISTIMTNINVDMEGGYASPGTNEAKIGAAGTYYVALAYAVEDGVLFSHGVNNSEQVTELTDQVGAFEVSFMSLERSLLDISAGVEVETVSFEFNNRSGIGLFGTFDPQIPEPYKIDYNMLYGGGTIPGVVPGSGSSPMLELLYGANMIMANQPLSVDDFFLHSGATLTSLENEASSFFRVEINASNHIFLEGTIDVSGKGFPGGEGPGAGSDVSFGGASGATYGGNGGRGSETSVRGGAYGNLFGDLTLGSGGGNSGQTSGGAGGGYVKLTAGVSISAGVDPGTRAIIVADGLSGETDSIEDEAAGSGSGGAIELVSTGIVELFNVSLSARGGPVTTGGDAFGGAGGGGKIWIDSSQYFSWEPLNPRDVRVVSPHSATAGQLPYTAGGGIISEWGRNVGKWIIVDNGNIETLESTPLHDDANTTIALDYFHMIRGSRAKVPAGFDLDVPHNDAPVDNENNIGTWNFHVNGHTTVDSYLHLEGTWGNTWPDSDIDFNLVIENPSGTSMPFNPATNSVLVNNAIFEVRHNNVIEYFNNMTLGANGILTHGFNDDAQVSSLRISLSGNFFVQDGSVIDVSGKGYSAGNGASGGAGESVFTTGFHAAGGGHGGLGGDASGGFIRGGDSYGDYKDPVDLGSGGGRDYSSVLSALTISRGGGAIDLFANNIYIGSGVQILANGSGGFSSNGGGAGGSIKLASASVNGVTQSGSGATYIHAEGGNVCCSGFAGAGAGGRIFVENADLSQFLPGGLETSTRGGTSGGGEDGEDGTIFLGPVEVNMSTAITDLDIDEGTTATFAITLTRALPEDVGINLALSLGGAEVGDVELPYTTVTIPAGNLTGSFVVEAPEDSVWEGISGFDTYGVEITSTTDSSIALVGSANFADGNVNDNENDIQVYAIDGSALEGDTTFVTVSLSHESEFEVQINVGPAGFNGFAIPGDLQAGGSTSALSSPVVVPPGGRIFQLPYVTFDDALPESDEYISVGLSPAGSNTSGIQIQDAVGVAAVIDNDQPVGNAVDIQMLSAWAMEGDVMNIIVTVTHLQSGQNGTVRVAYDLNTSAGDGGVTSTQAWDGDILNIVKTSFVDVFYDGDNGGGYGVIAVTLAPDGILEGNGTGYESFMPLVGSTFDLVNSGFAPSFNTSNIGTMQILDAPMIEFSTSFVEDYDISLSSKIVVEVSPASPTSVSFDLAVAAISATEGPGAGADFEFPAKSFHLPAYTTEFTVPVNFTESPYFEFTEEFQVSITGYNVVGSNSVLTVSIVDGDQLEVEPIYPENGERWMDWVKVDDDTARWHEFADVACANTDAGEASAGVNGTYTNCVHAGELKVVRTSIDDCEKLEINDNLRVFNWTCDDAGGSASFYAYKLKEDKGLTDLIDFDLASPQFEGMFVELTDYAIGAITTSVEEAWWENPVEELNLGNCDDLSQPYAIYAGRTDLSCNMEINADHVSVVTDKDRTITFDNADFAPSCDGFDNYSNERCVLSAKSQDFLWLEGNFDGTANRSTTRDEADATVHLNQNVFVIMKNLKVSGGAIPLMLDTVNNSLLEDSRVSDHRSIENADGAAMLVNSKYNVFRNVIISNGQQKGLKLGSMSIENYFHSMLIVGFDDDGISTDSSSGNNLYKDISIFNISTEGVELRSDDNTMVNFVVGNVNSRGIRIGSGASGNKLSNAAMFDISIEKLDFTGSAGAEVHGTLYVDSGGCGSGGGVDAACQPNGGSTHTRVSGLNDAGAFVGELSFDDIVNTATDSGGFQYTYQDIDGYEWNNFENTMRIFAVGDVTNGSHRGYFGNSPASDTAPIVDFNLTGSDTAFRDKIADRVFNNCTGFNTDAQSSNEGRKIEVAFSSKTSVLFTSLEERIGDGVGDDNGICEEGEACVQLRNLGYDQDRETWTYSENCTVLNAAGGNAINNAEVYGHNFVLNQDFDDQFPQNWDFLDVGGALIATLSSTGAASEWVGIPSPVARKEGRYFFEVRVDGSAGLGSNLSVGFVTEESLPMLVDGTNRLGQIAGSAAIEFVAADIEIEGSTNYDRNNNGIGGFNPTGPFTYGDTLGIAIDYSTGQIWIRDTAGNWLRTAGAAQPTFDPGDSLATLPVSSSSNGLRIFIQSRIFGPNNVGVTFQQNAAAAPPGFNSGF